MQPYTYSESPLTPYAEPRCRLCGGPLSGSAAPNAKLADGSHLLDRAGDGMTAILFCDGAPDAEAGRAARATRPARPALRRAADPSARARPRSRSDCDADGEIARLFGAEPGTLYLLRPDLHIAGRWKTVVPGEILRTASLCLGRATP